MKEGSVRFTLDDALRSTREYWTPITAGALQVYYSAISFIPNCDLYLSAKRSMESTTQLLSPRHAQWDRCLQVLEEHRSAVYSVTYSPDGNYIVSGSGDRTIQIWDAGTGEPLARFGLQKNHPESGIRAVACSTNGRMIVSGSRLGILAIEDISSAQIIASFEGHKSESIVNIAFSPDDTLIVTCSYNDHQVRIWESGTGEVVATLDGHEGGEGILAVACIETTDGLCFLSASTHSIVRSWSYEKLEQPADIRLSGQVYNMTAAAFSYDGAQVAFGSEYGAVQIYNIGREGEMITQFLGHEDCICSVAFSHDGLRIASGSLDNTVQIWNSSSGDCLAKFEGHVDSVRSVAFSPDDLYLASGSLDKTVRVWDATTGGISTKLERHASQVNLVVLSPDNSQIASSSYDGTIKIWNSSTGQLVATSEQFGCYIYSVAFSPDNSTIVSCGSHGVPVWDVSTGEVHLMDETPKNPADLVAFSPDGSWIVCKNDHTVDIWNHSMKVITKILHCAGIFIQLISFSPDGSHLVTGDGHGSVLVWNISTGHVTAISEEPSDEVMLSLAFSSDGLHVISSSFSGVSVWDAYTGEHVSTSDPENRPLHAKQFDQPIFWCDHEGWLWFIHFDHPYPVRLCWVPPGRRSTNPECLRSSGGKVIMGSESGLVTILDVSSHPSFRAGSV
jgi:WD40 repeat protein